VARCLAAARRLAAGAGVGTLAELLQGPLAVGWIVEVDH
jgi:hypothetical protein